MARKEASDKNFYFKMDFKEWLTETTLTISSLAVRGFWIDLICQMEAAGKATFSGRVEIFARLSRCTAPEAESCLREMKDHKIASVDESDGVFIVTSRRLARRFETAGSRSEAANSRWGKSGDAKGDAKSMQNPDYDYDYDSVAKGEVQEGKPAKQPDPPPSDDLDVLVPAIVCAHPRSVSRKLTPHQVSQAQASAVCDILAEDRISAPQLLAKVMAIGSVVVAEWPPGDLKYLSSIERFFREREFNRPIEEWKLADRTAKSGRGQDRTDRNLQALSGANAKDGDP
jgi:hypothetical protein